MKENKTEDRELFDKIAANYSKKDIYPVSKDARKFQIETLMNLVDPILLKNKFDKVIEIGCGNGANSLYLENYYHQYTGMDFSTELIDIAKKNYGNSSREFYSGDIKDLDENNKYELIIGVGVLHHLPDLEEYLSYIARIGDDKSIFVFLEPQGENPLIQFLRYIRKNTDKSYSKTQIFFHKHELLEKFNNAGFIIQDIKYTGYFTPPFAQVIIKPIWFFRPLLKILISFDKLIQKLLPNKLSWNISFTAKRRSN